MDDFFEKRDANDGEIARALEALSRGAPTIQLKITKEDIAEDFLRLYKGQIERQSKVFLARSMVKRAIMFITDLTVPVYLVHAIDSGEYDHISIKEVKAAIDNHAIFPFLHERLGRDYFSGLTAEKKREFNEHWEALNNVVTPAELGATCGVSH